MRYTGPEGKRRRPDHGVSLILEGGMESWRTGSGRGSGLLWFADVIVLPAEGQEGLHGGAHVAAPPPDQSHPGLHRWLQGDADQFGELLEHAFIEEAAALALAQELEDGGDLAAAHDDVRGDLPGLELAEEDLVLDGVLVEEDQGLALEPLQGDEGLSRQGVGGKDAQTGGLYGQGEGVELVDVVQLHIHQPQIQHIVLHQLAAADGPELLQLYPDVRVDLVEGVQQLREEDGAQHGRDPDGKPALGRLTAAVLGGEVVALAENPGGPLVEGLSFAGEDQSAGAVGEEGDGELLLQVPDGDGYGGLTDKERVGGLGDAVEAGRRAEVAQLGEGQGNHLRNGIGALILHGQGCPGH